MSSSKESTSMDPCAGRREMELKSAEKTIANKDVLIKMLQNQVKKMEETFESKICETEQYRYKYMRVTEEVKALRNMLPKRKSSICQCGRKDCRRGSMTSTRRRSGSQLQIPEPKGSMEFQFELLENYIRRISQQKRDESEESEEGEVKTEVCTSRLSKKCKSSCEEKTNELQKEIERLRKENSKLKENDNKEEIIAMEVKGKYNCESASSISFKSAKVGEVDAAVNTVEEEREEKEPSATISDKSSKDAAVTADLPEEKTKTSSCQTIEEIQDRRASATSAEERRVSKSSKTTDPSYKSTTIDENASTITFEEIQEERRASAKSAEERRLSKSSKTTDPSYKSTTINENASPITFEEIQEERRASAKSAEERRMSKSSKTTDASNKSTTIDENASPITFEEIQERRASVKSAEERRMSKSSKTTDPSYKSTTINENASPITFEEIQNERRASAKSAEERTMSKSSKTTNPSYKSTTINENASTKTSSTQDNSEISSDNTQHTNNTGSLSKFNLVKVSEDWRHVHNKFQSKEVNLSRQEIENLQKDLQELRTDESEMPESSLTSEQQQQFVDVKDSILETYKRETGRLKSTIGTLQQVIPEEVLSGMYEEPEEDFDRHRAISFSRIRSIVSDDEDDDETEVTIIIDEPEEKVLRKVEKNEVTSEEIDRIKSQISENSKCTEDYAKEIGNLKAEFEAFKTENLLKFDENKSTIDNLVAEIDNFKKELEELKDRFLNLAISIEEINILHEKQKKLPEKQSRTVQMEESDEILTVEECQFQLLDQCGSMIERPSCSIRPFSSMNTSRACSGVLHLSGDPQSLSISNYRMLQEHHMELQRERVEKDKQIECLKKIVDHYNKLSESLTKTQAIQAEGVERVCKCPVENVEILQQHILKITEENENLKVTMENLRVTMDKVNGRLEDEVAKEEKSKNDIEQIYSSVLNAHKIGQEPSNASVLEKIKDLEHAEPSRSSLVSKEESRIDEMYNTIVKPNLNKKPQEVKKITLNPISCPASHISSHHSLIEKYKNLEQCLCESLWNFSVPDDVSSIKSDVKTVDGDLEEIYKSVKDAHQRQSDLCERSEESAKKLDSCSCSNEGSVDHRVLSQNVRFLKPLCACPSVRPAASKNSQKIEDKDVLGNLESYLQYLHKQLDVICDIEGQIVNLKQDVNGKRPQ